MTRLDDDGVIEAFVSGTPAVAGPTLHVERDILYCDGWWHVAFRLAGDVFLVRDEPTPDGTLLSGRVTAALQQRGLRDVPVDPTELQVVTYTELVVISQRWQMWAPDEERGRSVLATRARAESEPATWDEAAMDDAMD